MKALFILPILLLLIGCVSEEESNKPSGPAPEDNSYIKLKTGDSFTISLHVEIQQQRGILCKDGWISQSQNRSGTCSSHGGVKNWNWYGETYSHYTGPFTNYVVADTMIYNYHLGIDCFQVNGRLLSQKNNEMPKVCGKIHPGEVDWYYTIDGIAIDEIVHIDDTDDFIVTYNGITETLYLFDNKFMALEGTTFVERELGTVTTVAPDTYNFATYINEQEVVYEDGEHLICSASLDWYCTGAINFLNKKKYK